MRHVGIGSCWFEFSARSQWTRSTKIGSSTVGRGRGKTSCFKLGHGRGRAVGVSPRNIVDMVFIL